MDLNDVVRFYHACLLRYWLWLSCVCDASCYNVRASRLAGEFVNLIDSASLFSSFFAFTFVFFLVICCQREKRARQNKSSVRSLLFCSLPGWLYVV